MCPDGGTHVSGRKTFPPVPNWRPPFAQPVEDIVERVAYYTDRRRDFAVFRHGTCVLLPQNGLAEEEVAIVAKQMLDDVYMGHPDMNPMGMDDGNIAIQYNHPVINVVLTSFTQMHWQEIDRHHQEALTTSEVLLTPLGPNVFDEAGKKALFGRCFMFMDAQDPHVTRVVRATVNVPVAVYTRTRPTVVTSKEASHMGVQKQLRRSQDRMIAGVCGGIATHFGLPATRVRVLYVLVSVLSAGFPGILVYLVLWALLPES